MGSFNKMTEEITKPKKTRNNITLKQKTAAKIVAAELMVNLGSKKGKKKALVGGKILEKAGYSKSIQQNPKMVFNSKGFTHLMSQMGFSDYELLVVHKELLESEDDRIRLSALDMGYKLRDLFPSQKIQLGKLDELGDILTETDVERADKAKKVVIEPEVSKVSDKEQTKETPENKESPKV